MIQLIERKFPKYVKDSKHRISRKVESNEIHKQIDGTRKKYLTLTEVTQAQKTKDKYVVYSFICAH